MFLVDAGDVLVEIEKVLNDGVLEAGIKAPAGGLTKIQKVCFYVKN